MDNDYHLLGDDNHHSHRRGNLKSYIVFLYEVATQRQIKVLIRATRCHLPEDDNHHSHRRGNLKSYKIWIVCNSILGGKNGMQKTSRVTKLVGKPLRKWALGRQ
jgi:hypothetical protein